LDPNDQPISVFLVVFATTIIIAAESPVADRRVQLSPLARQAGTGGHGAGTWSRTHKTQGVQPPTKYALNSFARTNSFAASHADSLKKLTPRSVFLSI